MDYSYQILKSLVHFGWVWFILDKLGSILLSLIHFEQVWTNLTLSRPGEPLWPPSHEYVCPCGKVRATLTKLPVFVPFDICQVPESHFWCLFFKKLVVKNFGGIGKKYFFPTNKYYFFKLNMNFTCSKLSFKTHCTIETQNFWNFEFFY